MLRKIKNSAKGALASAFQLGQRLGFDVLPRHFYSEVPNIHQLKSTKHWREPLALEDIHGAIDLDSQASVLSGWVTPEAKRQITERDLLREASERNGEIGYGPIEADCLYAFVHTNKPARIIQIGCGVSTAICLMAAKDAGYKPQITCVEPYPTDFLTREAAAGNIELVRLPVELLPIERLSGLSAGDLFFIDSTHTLGPAGEVTRLILGCLPQLPDGVYIHFHDIWMPYDYSPRLLAGELFFWHETALLLAYLSGNSRRRVLVSMCQLHHSHPQTLAECFPDYKPAPMDHGIMVGDGDFPTACYLLTGPVS
jgi:hypothetical protein